MGAVEVQPGLFVRCFTPPLRLGDFKLVAFDMDSTLINIECVDEIAAAADRKAEVAAITEAAMRGEISDYRSSLRQRLALLRGVPVSALEAVYSQHLQLNPGVETFVQACQAAGLKTLLVSGVDGAEKRRVLLEVAELMGIAPEQAIAVGDGANDLPMMGVAGLSIAYHPKPAVLQQAMLSITQGGMDRALSLLQA